MSSSVRLDYLRSLRKFYEESGRCAHCGHRMMDTEREQSKRCWKCRAKRSLSRQSESHKTKAREEKKIWYARNKLAIRERRAARRLEWKIAGKCHSCPSSAPDGSLCDECARKSNRRRRS